MAAAVCKRSTLKPLRLLAGLFLWIALGACGLNAGESLAQYTAHPFTSDGEKLAYTFAYPSAWSLRETDEQTLLAPAKRLIDDPPGEFSKEQALVVIRVWREQTTPQAILERYAAQHSDGFQFSQPAAYQVDGRPAARMESKRIQNGEENLQVAVKLDEGVWGLVGARLGPGGVQTWQETLLAIAASLRLEQGQATQRFCKGGVCRFVSSPVASICYNAITLFLRRKPSQGLDPRTS